MDSQEIEQGLTQKSDHELLVMLVAELQNIRQLLEAGYEYSIKMDESRSGAWAATYSGSARARTPRTGIFDVILLSVGKDKNSVINAICELQPSYSLREAKDSTNPGAYILSGVNANVSQAAKFKLESVGATVELKART